MIEHDEDFSEFPQDRCTACGVLIGKDERFDDICDDCVVAIGAACAVCDDEQESAA